MNKDTLSTEHCLRFEGGGTDLDDIFNSEKQMWR